MEQSKTGSELAISEKKREEAKRLYFNHWGAREISDWLKVKYATVRKWITRYDWAKERAAIEVTEIQEIAQRRTSQINNITKDGFDAVMDTIKRTKLKGATLEEAAKIAKMLGEIDKLYRLQTGQATEIKEERKITTEVKMGTKDDIKRAIAADPFIEVEFKDVSKEEESTEE